MRQQESKSGLLRGACHRARIRATRWLAMTARCTFAFPRHHAPELCLNDPPKRGRGATPRGERGMPGARCTRSRAWWVVNTRVSHHGRTGITRHSRTRMVLTVYFVLSLVTGLSCHHRPQEALLLENLTPASGRQDHTTSPSADKRSRQQRSLRPSHPNPTFVTIAKRPSVWAGMARGGEVIWVKREAKYFLRGGLDR